jgi:hypothetical protein
MIRLGVHYEYPFGGMAPRDEWLPRGADDWRRDCAMIRDTGFDIIRIRIGQDSSLDDVAELLDIAHEHELEVLFGFATFYVPWWFVEQHPDSRVVDRNGNTLAQEPLDFRWPRVCIDHPAFRAARNELIDLCAERFASHPAVTSWDVHNEPCLAHGGHPCYCTNTVAAYRRSVASAFDSIAAFNESTGQAFGAFEAIEPPRAFEGAERGWRHWREFLNANLSAFLLEAVDIVKRHAPGVPVTYNVDPIGPWKIQDFAIDWWTSRELDFLTTSHYGASNESTASMGLNLAVLKALAGGKESWVTEFQGGPAPSGLFAGVWTAKDLELEISSSVGNGMRGLIFYRWEPIVNGQETSMMHIVDADDYDTDRRLGIKATIERLRSVEPIIDAGRNRTPRAAVYLRRHHLHDAEERRAPFDSFVGYLHDTLRGYYGILTQRGYETGVVVDDIDAAAPYQLVVFPYLVDEGDMAAVRTLVDAGGRAIVELPARDLERARAIAAAFGLEAAGHEFPGRYHPIAGWNLRDAGGAIAAYGYDSRVLLAGAGGGRVLLAFGDNGSPAALLPRGYDDRLLVVACGLGYGQHLLRHHGARQFIGDWVESFLEPDVRVTGVPKELSPLVEARLLEGDVGALVLVMNRSHDDLQLEVGVPGYRQAPVAVAGHAVAHVPLQSSERSE